MPTPPLASGIGLTQPTHAYSQPGVYIVTLSVQELDSQTGEVVLENSSQTSATIDADIIADAGGPYTGVINVPVEFNAVNTVGAPLDEIVFDWDFGDDIQNPPTCGVLNELGFPVSHVTFGVSEVGETVLRTLTVLAGGTDLTITPTFTPGAQENVFDSVNIPAGQPHIIPANTLFNLILSFTPTAIQGYSAFLQLNPICPVIVLSGTGVPTGGNDPVCEYPDHPGTGVVTLSTNTDSGTISSVSLKVANTGGETLTGTIVKLSGDPEFTLIGAPTYSIPGGQEQVFTFEYAPNDVGTHTATFDIGTDCPRDLTINGTAGSPPAPACQLNQSSFNFGPIAVGATVNADLIVSNVGSQNLIGSVNPQCTTGSGFTVDGVVNGTIAFNIASQQSRSFNVQFQPTTEGSQSCTVTIDDNAPANPCSDVSLTGEGFESSGNDPPGCVSGDRRTTGWSNTFTSGFWGPQNDANNQHGAFKARHDDIRWLSENGDTTGTMLQNTKGGFYLGENNLESGTIIFDMRVNSVPELPDHPVNGFPASQYMLFEGECIPDCDDPNATWYGGRTSGGQHYWELQSSSASEAGGTWMQFDVGGPRGVQKDFKVILQNTVNNSPLNENVWRGPTPNLAVDVWITYTISWLMYSTVPANKYDRCDLTWKTDGFAPVTRTFTLLPGTCGVGRIFSIGNVDRSVFNIPHTGVMNEVFTPCPNNPSLAECTRSSDSAPFTGVSFRNIRIPIT